MKRLNLCGDHRYTHARKTCTVCRAPADPLRSYSTVVSTCTISRNGAPTRGQAIVTEHYCANHWPSLKGTP